MMQTLPFFDFSAAPAVAAEAFALLCTPLAPWHASRLGLTLHDYQGAQVNAASRSPYPDECVGKLVCDTFCLAQAAALARLEEFHLCVAHRMAKSAYHVGDGTIGIYPPSDKVLEECGMHTIQHNIDVQRQTIAKYVVNCSIFMECQGADRRHDSVPRWW